MTTTKTSLFQRHGVEIYGTLAAIALLTSWVLAGAHFAEFGVEAVRAWMAVAVAVAFAGMSLKASEVRKARA